MPGRILFASLLSTMPSNMISVNFNAVIKAWLDADPADRDLEQGALLLLQLDRNNIKYQSRLRNLQSHAEEMEAELRESLTVRESMPSPAEEEAIRQEARRLVSSPMKDNNPAAEFKAGKRADHDSLPEDIQKLYVENGELREKMRQYHLEIRHLLKKKTACASKDLKVLCQLLKETDLLYRANWHSYDGYGK